MTNNTRRVDYASNIGTSLVLPFSLTRKEESENYSTLIDILIYILQNYLARSYLLLTLQMSCEIGTYAWMTILIILKKLLQKGDLYKINLERM